MIILTQRKGWRAAIHDMRPPIYHLLDTKFAWRFKIERENLSQLRYGWLDHCQLVVLIFH